MAAEIEKLLALKEEAGDLSPADEERLKELQAVASQESPASVEAPAAAPDPAPDAAPEASPDAAPEAALEATTEAALEVAPDAAPDAATMAEEVPVAEEAQAEAPAEAPPDAPAEVLASDPADPIADPIAETLAEPSAEAAAEAPAEVPAEAAVETPAEAPTEASDDLPEAPTAAVPVPGTTVIVGPILEDTVAASGLKALRRRLGDGNLLDFPKRDNGMALMLRQNFFEKLLEGKLDLKDFQVGDVAAARADLKHLTIQQLLKIRVDNLELAAVPPSKVHGEFLTSCTTVFQSKLASRLGSGSLAPPADVERQVQLLYGANMMLSEVAAPLWLLKVGKFNALLDLPSVLAKPLNGESPWAYCPRSLSRASAAVSQAKRQLQWEVELCDKPAEFKADLAVDKTASSRRAAAADRFKGKLDKAATSGPGNDKSDSQLLVDTLRTEAQLWTARVKELELTEAAARSALEKSIVEVATLKDSVAAAQGALESEKIKGSRRASTMGVGWTSKDDLAKEVVKATAAGAAIVQEGLDKEKSQTRKLKSEIKAAQDEVTKLKEELAALKPAS